MTHGTAWRMATQAVACVATLRGEALTQVINPRPSSGSGPWHTLHGSGSSSRSSSRVASPTFLPETPPCIDIARGVPFGGDMRWRPGRRDAYALCEFVSPGSYYRDQSFSSQQSGQPGARYRRLARLRDQHRSLQSLIAERRSPATAELCFFISTTTYGNLTVAVSSTTG